VIVRKINSVANPSLMISHNFIIKHTNISVCFRGY